MALYNIKKINLVVIYLCIYFFTGLGAAYAQDETRRYVLLIVGLGGSQEYREKFHKYLYETRKNLIEKFQFSENNIIVLADSRSEEENFINEISTAENIKAQFSYLSKKVTDKDDIYIFLFGHGSFDGKNAMLNIPRRDLKDADYAELVQTFNARRIIFINTTSCSAPFITHLSAPGRIIITATKSGTERNETIFPKFLIEAMNSSASDKDKNGDLSVLEVFQYASERTARWYEESNHLATEHPLLEDTGDKSAYRAEELIDYAEGSLSSITYLLERTRAVATAMASTGDSVFAKLFLEQKKINQEISLLKAEKTKYTERDYFAKLESFFIRLAKISDEIEKYEKLH